MLGFYGRVLRINLTDKSFTVENIPDEIYTNYLGGKGLGTYLLVKDKVFDVDPLSEGGEIIFTVGPATDTSIYGSSRYGVFTKSPLTEIYSESYSGGDVAQHISKTGFDGIIVKGKSREPVFMEISDKTVEFHSASKLWGKSTYETEDYLRETFGENTGIITIGPAGENLVKFACIENNFWRSAGRTGAGTILGSKKIKGIIFHGNEKKEIYSQKAVDDFAKKILKRGKDSEVTKTYKNFGTPMLVAITNLIKGFPSRYWHEGTLDGWEKITAESMKKILNPKPKACPKCFLACGKLSEIKEGRHEGLKIEGPEYETIYAFGGLCLIDDLKEIAHLNDICDRLGMDTITAGNLVSFTMEASELGKIDYKIEYGNAEKAAILLKEIAYRKGIGNILAEGIRYVSKKWGMQDVAIHVKGLEPAGYDPRVLKGMSLAYATSSRGACHLRSTFYKAELSGTIDKDEIKGKAEIFIDFEDRLALHDSLIVCRFYRDLYMWDELVQIVNMTTGLNLDKEQLQKIAENIVNITRYFNNKCGISKKQDNLPKRFFNEPINRGKDYLRQEDFITLLKDYYRLRKWNEDGIVKTPHLLQGEYK